MRLLIATHNGHKTEEIRAILGPAWDVLDLNSLPEFPAPEETGATFAENAAIKALSASQRHEGLVLADDSGLEVDALGGDPGVRSARYAGPHATDAENRARLLRELPHTRPHAARFRCAMVLAEGDTIRGTFEGSVEGVIVRAGRGDGGFGYDSLFVPDGHTETFAQLPPAVKNALSHRARALAQVVSFLAQWG